MAASARWWWVVGTVVLAVGSWTAPVRAEPSDSEPANAVVTTPPAPLARVLVPYPREGAGEAIVVLEVTLSASGAVVDVRVVRGEEPFASAAKRAVVASRFSPATRDGEPVAARVRMEVRFTPPPPPDDGASSGGPASAADRHASADADVTEVLVEADARPPGADRATPAEARLLPGAFGDPFRAIEAQPGVAPVFSGSPYLFVRGAPPGNVGYFIDGIPVPLLFHVAAGPSVIQPGLVQNVDFYPGAYPARYGRFAGGIVAAESVPARETWHGEGNVRVFDAGAMVEAPFADARGATLVGGRYAYTSELLSDLLKDVRYEYWDYQGRVGYDLGSRDRVEAFAFGASDFLATAVDILDDDSTLFDTQFHRVDLRHIRRFGEASRARTGVTLGLDRTRGDDVDFGRVRHRSVRARTDVVHRLPGGVVRGGADVQVADFDVRLPANPDSLDELSAIGRNFPSRGELTTGVYVEGTWPVAPRVTLEPGVRADVFTSRGDVAVGVDPRLAATFRLSERVRTVHAVGITHQRPSFWIPAPGLSLAGLDGGLQRGVQTSAGVEVAWPESMTSRVTFFHNAVFHASDQLSLNRIGVTSATELEVRTFGRTVGVELLLERPLTERLGGLLAYTLSQSVRSVGRFSGPGGFDRRHVLNAALSYDFGRGWRAGGRVLAYSGSPAEVSTLERARNPPRTRPFTRLDLRGEKRWLVGEAGAWIALVLEVLNTTASKEEILLECDDFGCTSDELGPLTLPSIGVEAAF